MRFSFLVLLFLVLKTSLAHGQSKIPNTVIAFGSCAQQTKPQPILQQIADIKPDFFIYLGDNIYGDTYEVDELKTKYEKLISKPEFQALKQSTKILATWDDHDYGWNDVGRHYPLKKESKEIFLHYFDEPQDSKRRSRDGIYTSYMYDYQGNKLQIILLDTRTFRDNLRPYKGELSENEAYFYTLDYSPHTNGDSTLLGADQWKWLEMELAKPADVRIIASSTQFAIEYNGYESWANFPNEQQRMLKTIQKSGANGVVFISGDVHYAEISKIQLKNSYPIYDFTSSGITSTWHFATPNKNRIEGPVMENHYGKITIDWNKKDPTLTMETIDVTGNQRFEFTIPISQLRR
ncbi:MAG: alkaline phosphatase family protein [Saprospiraceae bacterium]|nr:alkaline phosphatase family protein [Saprospiraceae bacterium]